MSIYTLCISRHLTSASTTPTDHPSWLAMGQIWDRLEGDQIDKMNALHIQKSIYYFKLCELSDLQMKTLDDAISDGKKLILDCFSPSEIALLEWPGTMVAGMGGDITYANIEVQ